MANVKNKKPLRKAVMIGLGLDSDGKKRITTGPRCPVRIAASNVRPSRGSRTV